MYFDCFEILQGEKKNKILRFQIRSLIYKSSIINFFIMFLKISVMMQWHLW